MRMGSSICQCPMFPSTNSTRQTIRDSPQATTEPIKEVMDLNLATLLQQLALVAIIKVMITSMHLPINPMVTTLKASIR